MGNIFVLIVGVSGMDIKQLENIQKVNAEIANFRACYDDPKDQLWGQREGPVTANDLLLFLMDNPHYQEIADRVRKLYNNQQG